jgi:hypothetical protein
MTVPELLFLAAKNFGFFISVVPQLSATTSGSSSDVVRVHQGANSASRLKYFERRAIPLPLHLRDVRAGMRQAKHMKIIQVSINLIGFDLSGGAIFSSCQIIAPFEQRNHAPIRSKRQAFVCRFVKIIHITPVT